MTKTQKDFVEQARAMHGKYVLLRDKSVEERNLLQTMYNLFGVIDALDADAEGAYKRGYQDGFLAERTSDEAKAGSEQEKSGKGHEKVKEAAP